MIIDCFPFFNELKLLKIRLKLLENIVDRVVLVESTRTFSLKKKKLFYNENKILFEKYNNKITHVVVNDTPALFNRVFLRKPRQLFWLIKKGKSFLLNPHHIDFHQKNKIADGLKDCDDEDVLLLSDLDEIPNPEIFNDLSFLRKNKKGALILKNFCYFLNGKLYDERNEEVLWPGPAVLKFKDFRSFHAERREAIHSASKGKKNNFTIIKDAGWHFGYLGGLKKVQYKIRSAAHSELNTKELNNKKKIKTQIDEGNFVIKEKNWKAKYQSLEDLFPDNICNIFRGFPSLIKKI